MIDERRFDAIVAGFYGAATGATSWDEALTDVHAAFGTRAAVMQSVDMTTGRITQLSHGGPPAHAAVLEYLRHWHTVDPRRDHLLAHPEQLVDRWWHCHEHFDDTFAAQDGFYSHFLPAHETRYLSTTATMVTPTLMTAFGLELPASRGPLTKDERHTAERLGRHVADALRAHERIRRLAAQALAGHGLLEAFAYPMWLLDADRFVFHANASARAAQASEEVAALRDDRLVWQQPRADRLLGEHLHTLGASPHGTRANIDARRRPSDPPMWLHLHVLVPGQVLGAFGDRPQMLATLFDPRQMSELDPFALSDVFGMTPAEGRVAALLAEGMTAQAIGAQFGCSVNTVRTHLRRVMEKLGARRLADAVRLLRQGEALWAQAGTAPTLQAAA